MDDVRRSMAFGDEDNEFEVVDKHDEFADEYGVGMICMLLVTFPLEFILKFIIYIYFFLFICLLLFSKFLYFLLKKLFFYDKLFIFLKFKKKRLLYLNKKIFVKGLFN